MDAVILNKDSSFLTTMLSQVNICSTDILIKERIFCERFRPHLLYEREKEVLEHVCKALNSSTVQSFGKINFRMVRYII